MAIHWKILAIVILLAADLGCSSSRHSSYALRLPADGDAVSGRNAFVALGCPACHDVGGMDMPRPTVQPPVRVMLGGAVSARLSDAYLVTSIINPSADLAPYPKEQITANGASRMPSYEDRISVRQLTDVVAFLQSRYWVTQRQIIPPLTVMVGKVAQ